MSAVADIPVLIWHGCYDGQWRDIIVPEAFAHPAKFAPNLVRRICAHGMQRGWWKPGDLIGDPFGGIAGGGIMAGYAGLNWIGVELEPKFVEMGNRNLALHGPKWMAMGSATVVKLVQGDSRRFVEVVREAAAVVTSPPFGVDQPCASQTRNIRDYHARGDGTKRDKQMASGGNIAALPVEGIDAVITSPPYAETAVEKNSTGIDIAKQWETYRASGGGMSLEKFKAQQARHSAGYGSSDGQIAALKSGELLAIVKEGDVDGVVTSPPFLTARSGTTWSSGGIQANGTADGDDVGARTYLGGAGIDRGPGNIEQLPPGDIAGVVTSPPYEDTLHTNESSEADCERLNRKGLLGTRNRIGENSKIGNQGYSDNPGQIGESGGETYWAAVAQVYTQCLLSLRPGGVMCVVVKDYVKGGQRVPLCDQTLRLLTHLGFEPVERIRAMLVSERRHAGLFGEHVERRERKSFFRRLAEKKGSPRIDWEEIIVARKPDLSTRPGALPGESAVASCDLTVPESNNGESTGATA